MGQGSRVPSRAEKNCPNHARVKQNTQNGFAVIWIWVLHEFPSDRERMTGFPGLFRIIFRRLAGLAPASTLQPEHFTDNGSRAGVVIVKMVRREIVPVIFQLACCGAGMYVRTSQMYGQASLGAWTLIPHQARATNFDRIGRARAARTCKISRDAH